jgi:hypothetical protein
MLAKKIDQGDGFLTSGRSINGARAAGEQICPGAAARGAGWQEHCLRAAAAASIQGEEP